MSQYQDIKNSRGNGNGNGNGNGKKGMSRRDFFKWSAGAAAAGTAVDWALVGPSTAVAAPDKTIRNICPYCSVGCGIKIDVTAGVVTDIYGDESSVISRGALCSKGSALKYLSTSDQRVTDPKVKVDGTWYSATWAEVLGSSTFLKGGKTIPSVPMALGKLRVTEDQTNKLYGPDSVAFLGSSHMTNEECYLYKKFTGVFGTNNIEHQARI